MRLYLLLLGAIAFAKLGTAQYRAPIDSSTINVNLSDASLEEVSQPFEYSSNEVNVTGIARFNPIQQTLALQGRYLSDQNLDPDINLAFQIYDAKKELVFMEGERSPFRRTDSGFVSDFDYTVSVPSLGIGQSESTLYIQFNYVLEFQYWADQKFPNIELPALKVIGIDIHNPIRIPFSWIPTFAARNTNTYSIHLFSVSSRLPSATLYKASIDANYRDSFHHDDNKRYEIKENQLDRLNFLVARMKFEQAGKVDRRLSFVQEGVRWHNRPSETYRTTWVVPLWLYVSIATCFAGALHSLFSFACKRSTKRSKRLLLTLWVLGTIVFLIEFCSSVTFTLLICYLAFLVVKSCSEIEYKSYWTIAFFLATEELIWHNFAQSPSYLVNGIIISVLLSAILAAPLVLIKSRSALAVIGNSILLLGSFIFISTNIYYAFFQDLPTWNILNYASQGLDITDSIASLFTEQHSLVALTLIYYTLLLNLSLFPAPHAIKRIHLQRRIKS